VADSDVAGVQSCAVSFWAAAWLFALLWRSRRSLGGLAQTQFWYLWFHFSIDLAMLGAGHTLCILSLEPPEARAGMVPKFDEPIVAGVCNGCPYVVAG